MFNKSVERMRTAAGKRILKQATQHEPGKTYYHGTHIEDGKQIFNNGGYCIFSLAEYVQGLPEVDKTDLNDQKYFDKAINGKTVEIILPKLEEVEKYIEQAKAGAKADKVSLKKYPERLGYYIEYSKGKFVLVNSLYLRDVLIIVPDGKAYVSNKWNVYIEDKCNNQAYLCGCYHRRNSY